jgi:hypothetical protein
MNVWLAPRRTIDYFVARAEGFVLIEGPRPVEGPGQPLLVPPGGHSPTSKNPLPLMAMVPMFTRDWGTGGPLIQRDCLIPTARQVRAVPDCNLLEACMRLKIEQLYGPEIPTLEDMYSPAMLGKSVFPRRPAPKE